jgi:hypothetical protein
VAHRLIEMLDGRVVDHATAPHLVNTAGEIC